MPRAPGQLARAQGQIQRSFESGPRIYSPTELQRFFEINRTSWNLSESIWFTKFTSFVLDKMPLRELELPFPYRPVTRFIWGNVSMFALVQSIKPEGYFSHYSAMHLHGLTEQIPKTIYLNHEQQASGGGGELTQEAIDRVFRGKCRTSNNFVTLDDVRICLINGRNTDQLGVAPVHAPDGTEVRATNFERTLIDATVRPIYSGGVFEVAKAFRNAQPRVSINKLMSLLRTLEFGYPYHQAIGFYLEHAGRYKNSQIDMLREFKTEFDFYLDYGIKNPVYNSRWRLFVPKGF